MNTRWIQPGFSFEYLMWIFTRISGIAMATLAAVGLLFALIYSASTPLDFPTIIRWSIFPNPNHLAESIPAEVMLSWRNAFWQVVQILMVFFGVTHGINGLRVVIEDFVCKSISCVLIRGFLFMLWGFILIIAIYVIMGS